jgi:hypothetical protein
MFLIKLAKLYLKRKSASSFPSHQFAVSQTNQHKPASGMLRLAPYLLILPIIVFHGKSLSFSTMCVDAFADPTHQLCL